VEQSPKDCRNENKDIQLDFEEKLKKINQDRSPNESWLISFLQNRAV
jgi:hypothetical protein